MGPRFTATGGFLPWECAAPGNAAAESRGNEMDCRGQIRAALWSDQETLASTQHRVEAHIFPHLGALLFIMHEQLTITEVLALLLALGCLL